MQPQGGSSLILNLMRRAQAQKEPALPPPGLGMKPPGVVGAGMTAREKSDLKEEEFKMNRELNPEASRAELPLQLLKDRCQSPFGWVACVNDEANRSWMYLADRKQDIQLSDLQTLLSSVKWIDVAASPGGKVTRKTMWFVKEGCRCPYNYGTHRVAAEPFPDWFMDMSKRWLSCFNLDDADRDSRFPDSVNLNLYENGSQIVAWHSDDEPLFRGKQQDTRIISVSLGAPRKFQVGFRSPRRGGILAPEKGSQQTFTLGHGVLSTMEGLFQKHYLHQIAKGGVTGGPRVNATFRYIEDHVVGCPMRRG
jgi:alkylated DNA repair dioxygenase AlkB